MRKVNMAQYYKAPFRFELKKGTSLGAPLCPYVNHFEWIGFDKELKEYLRFTKSVFKILITQHSN